MVECHKIFGRPNVIAFNLHCTMNTRTLLICSAALLGGVVLWRFVDGESDVADLRSRLAKIESASAANPPPAFHAPAQSSRESAPSSAADETLAHAQDELREARERISELEATVGDLTQAWNRFAEDEENKRVKASMRGWGPEQAGGPPDTNGAGDKPSAWAAQAPDGGTEWLQTEYANAVEAAQIRVLENDNPGAVVKITGFTEAGAEVVLWQGDEPRAAAPADQIFNVSAGIRVRSVRVWLDTAKVPGWNEIDAVELIGRDGSRQWAKSATASSTYASPHNGFGGRLGDETFLYLR